MNYIMNYIIKTPNIDFLDCSDIKNLDISLYVSITIYLNLDISLYVSITIYLKKIGRAHV